MILKLITAPTVEPVSKADVKEWIRVASAITTDDNLVDATIRATRKAVESHLKRALMTQTWDMFLDDPLPVDVLELPLPPLQSVTGIYLTDTSDVEGAALASSKYLVDANDPMAKGRVILKSWAGQSWDNSAARPMLGTRIRFVAGYGATASSGATAGSCPEDIVLAMKRAILDHYEHRENLVVGTIGAELKLSIGAQKLLAPYRVLRV